MEILVILVALTIFQALICILAILSRPQSVLHLCVIAWTISGLAAIGAIFTLVVIGQLTKLI